MHRWRDYESFWQDAIVMLRDEHDDPVQLINALGALNAWSDEELDRWSSMICPVPMIDASSTLIRSALSEPTKRENPIVGLDDRVHEYILEHGLYRD